MAQDINTQTILDNLEEVIESRNRWYKPLEYSWKSLAEIPKYWYFFPKEIAEIIPLDDSQKGKIKKARKWFRDNVSEKDDDVVSMYEFPEPWPEMKVEPFRILYKQEFLESCAERYDREGSLQLCVEMKKLDYMLFTSDEMLEVFVERNCPILNMRIKRWKLLNELREYLQEIRVARK